MKRNVVMFVLLAALSFPVLALYEQDVCATYYGEEGYLGADTLGCDSIIIGCVRIPDAGVIEGDSIPIPVYVWMDSVEYIQAFTLGFVYDYDNVEITSFSFAGGMLAASAGTKQQLYQPDQNKVLTGYIDFNPSGTKAPSTGRHLLLTMYMQILPGAQPGTNIDLDSTVVGPAGTWEFDVKNGTSADKNSNIPPLVSDCPDGTPDIILNVEEIASAVLPDDYMLKQNSPNPFNPETSIDFAIPHSGHVHLDIFNTLGQKVKTLVDEPLNAGFKRVQWDGRDNSGHEVASGVYFYRMSVDNFTASKKMLLLK